MVEGKGMMECSECGNLFAVALPEGMKIESKEDLSRALKVLVEEHLRVYHPAAMSEVDEKDWSNVREVTLEEVKGRLPVMGTWFDVETPEGE